MRQSANCWSYQVVEREGRRCICRRERSLSDRSTVRCLKFQTGHLSTRLIESKISILATLLVHKTCHGKSCFAILHLQQPKTCRNITIQDSITMSGKTSTRNKQNQTKTEKQTQKTTRQKTYKLYSWKATAMILWSQAFGNIGCQSFWFWFSWLFWLWWFSCFWFCCFAFILFCWFDFLVLVGFVSPV